MFNYALKFKNFLEPSLSNMIKPINPNMARKYHCIAIIDAEKIK